MSGKEIRERIITAGLNLWQVADAYGVTDATFSRKLRHDFNDAETNKLLAIIDELKAKK